MKRENGESMMSLFPRFSFSVSLSKRKKQFFSYQPSAAIPAIRLGANLSEICDEYV